MKVPNTSRYVMIGQLDEEKVAVKSNQLSDCLTLQTEHIQTTDGLNLFVDLSLILSNPKDAPDTASEWQQTIQHLLDTFHPDLLIIHKAETHILKTFGGKTNAGSTYEGTWIDDDFVITRKVLFNTFRT